MVSRHVRDAYAIEEGLKALVTEAGVHLVMVFGVLGLLFALNVQLTLVIIPYTFSADSSRSDAYLSADC